jgi:hypothetical protein
LFNCIITNNDESNSGQDKNEIVFFKDYPGGAGNVNTSYLKTNLMNVTYGDFEQDVWVIGDNELLQAQLELSIESLEYLNLYCRVSKLTNTLLSTAIGGIHEEVNREESVLIDEFVRRSVKCVFIYTCVTHEALAFYRTTYLGEEFLANGTICHGMTKVLEFLKRDAEKGFDLITECFDVYNYHIQHSGLFKQDILPIIDELVSKIKYRTFILKKTLKKRACEREKILSKVSLKIEQEDKTLFNFLNIFFNHITIDKHTRLMKFEEDLQNWVSLSVQRKTVERKFNVKTLVNIQKLHITFENYIFKPTRNNLQRLLQHVELKFLTISKSIGFLRRLKEKVEVRQLKTMSLPTDDFINYDFFFEKVIRQIEAFNEITEKDIIYCTTPLYTIILSSLRTN